MVGMSAKCQKRHNAITSSARVSEVDGELGASALLNYRGLLRLIS